MRSALLDSQSVKILQAESKLIFVIFDIKKNSWEERPQLRS